MSPDFSTSSVSCSQDWRVRRVVFDGSNHGVEAGDNGAACVGGNYDSGVGIVFVGGTNV